MAEHRVLRSGKKWSQAPARYFRLYGGLARSRPGYMYVLTYRYARSARAVSIELSKTTGYAEPTASRARAGDSAVYFLHRSVHCTSIFHRRARVRTFYFQLRNISSANRVGTRRDLVHPIIHAARRRPWSIVVSPCPYVVHRVDGVPGVAQYVRRRHSGSLSFQSIRHPYRGAIDDRSSRPRPAAAHARVSGGRRGRRLRISERAEGGGVPFAFVACVRRPAPTTS
jgi:hypothetical protein